jgi:hypothetical protein
MLLPQGEEMRIRRFPLIIITTIVLGIFLGTLWLMSQMTEPLPVIASGENRLSNLAPVPGPANFIDRSKQNTLTVDGMTGSMDKDIQLYGGKSTIKGKVIREDGSSTKDRAIVELARWEGTRFNTVRINTDREGNFAAENLIGGRWSGRAWEPPKVASREAAAWFIIENETKEIELTTGEEAKREEKIAVNPSDTTFDEFLLLFSVVDKKVDESGRLEDLIVEGEIVIRWPNGYEGPLTAKLENGSALIVGKCVNPESEPNVPREGAIVFEGKSFDFTVPRCIPRPTTTTTTEPPTTTTTTVPSTTIPTTTTTLPVSPTTTPPSSSTTVVR